MNVEMLTLPHASHPRRATSVFGWLMALDATFRQRSALKSLDAHLLSDIGLTEAARRDEVSRPFWNV